MTSTQSFPPLNLPSLKTSLRTRSLENGELQILDRQRSKWVRLTPEEWVRQHFVEYLIAYLGYPQGRISNEVTIHVGKTTKRCDSVIYDKQGKPLMIVEYKAASVTLTQEVFLQIARYNIPLQVDYLVISNGIQHYCLRFSQQKKTYEFLHEIPLFDSL